MHSVERAHLHEGRISLGRLALEAAMIGFGVLLALSAESWREHRREQALAREALASIRAEIAAGAERIRQQIPRQHEVVRALETYEKRLENGERPDRPHLALYPAMLSAAAWNTALSTQALSHMELRTVRALASFYEARPWLDRIEDTWLRLVTEPGGTTPAAEQYWASSMRNTLLGYVEIESMLVTAAERVKAVTGSS